MAVNYPESSKIEFRNFWRAQKNAEFSEFKLASANMYYGNSSANEYRNAADLFQTRGAIDRASKRVIEAADQAGMQWDADIVGLNDAGTD